MSSTSATPQTTAFFIAPARGHICRSNMKHASTCFALTLALLGSAVQANSSPDENKATHPFSSASSAWASENSRDAVILKNSRLALSKIQHGLHDSLTASPFTERRALAESYLFCDLIAISMKCGSLDTQATCNSDAECNWDSGDCNPSGDLNEELNDEMTAGMMAIIGPAFTCMAATDTSSCTEDICTVYADQCIISDASVDNAFSDPSVAEMLKMSLRCGAHEDASGCSAASDCSWELDDDATSDTYGNNTCQLADDSTMTIVNEYCEYDAATGTWTSKESGAAGASSAAIAFALVVAIFTVFN